MTVSRRKTINQSTNEAVISYINKPLYVYSDVCDFSSVGGQVQPLFRIIQADIMSAYKTLYVPDPQKWTNFYLQIHRGKVSPYADHTMKGYQRGGGLRNKTSPFMLSIDKNAIDSNDKNM